MSNAPSTQPQMARGLEKFLLYQSDKKEKSYRSFVARASFGNKLPASLDHFPQGDIFIYEKYVAFLTLIEGTPTIWKYWVAEMKELISADLKAYQWIQDPSSVLEDLGEYVFGQKNQDTMAQALSNTNSFFLPLDTITQVRSGTLKPDNANYFLLPLYAYNYIAITAGKDEYLICQDVGEEMNESFGLGHFKVRKSLKNGVWQKEFLELLRSSATAGATI